MIAIGAAWSVRRLGQKNAGGKPPALLKASFLGFDQAALPGR